MGSEMCIRDRCCHDGTILHQGLGGHWSSADEGRNWHFHSTMECYYGQMVEVEPGRVLAVTQVNAGDEAYPHRYDAFLQGCFLTHRKRSQLHQCDVRAEMAFALTDVLPADGHLLAQLQCNGCTGLIARADQYTKNYFALVIQCGSGSDRFAGKPPASSNLSAAICKVTDGQVHVLAQRLCERSVGAEDLIEVQLTVHDDNLMTGIRLAGGRTTYLSARDDSLPEGQWGVFSDLSKATFRQLCASTQPSTIREGWSHLQ